MWSKAHQCPLIYSEGGALWFLGPLDLLLSVLLNSLIIIGGLLFVFSCFYVWFCLFCIFLGCSCGVLWFLCGCVYDKLLLLLLLLS